MLEPLGMQIERLLPTMRNIDIARMLGCSAGYVATIRTHGGHQGTLDYMRVRQEAHRRRSGVLTKAERMWQRSVAAHMKNAHIVAAVESGKTYAAVAREFEMSRSAVAGVVKRYKAFLASETTKRIAA